MHLENRVLVSILDHASKFYVRMSGLMFFSAKSLQVQMNLNQSSWIQIRDWTAFAASHHVLMGIYLLIVRFFGHLILPERKWEDTFTLFFVLHIIYILISYVNRVSRYPPGPPPMAVLGNSPFVNILRPEQTFLEYREIYGPIFTLHLSKPTVILADFTSIQDALVKNGQQTSGRSSAESFVLFSGDRINGDGVILAMREKWKNTRHHITRFLNKWYGQRMDQLVLHHTHGLEAELCKISDTKSLIDLRDPLAGAIANVIQQITIGRTFVYQDQEFQDRLADINAVVKEIMTAEVFFVNCYPLLRWLPEGILRKWTNYKKSGFRLQKWFKRILVEHLSEPHQGDYMSHMLESNEGGRDGYCDLTVVLTCGDLWTGGMETTVTTLRWGIIYLLNNPEVQARCHLEILAAFGSEIPDMSRMNETPYVRATLSEIQRLANVLPWAIPHKTLEACNIGGYAIPEDTEIIPALGAVLFDPKVFESPEDFKPERFMDEEEGKYRVMEEFRPFGMGPRVCLGERLARTELYLIFASLLQNFRFYLNTGDPIPRPERVIGGITAPPKPYATRVEYLGIRPIN